MRDLVRDVQYVTMLVTNFNVRWETLLELCQLFLHEAETATILSI